MSDLISRQKVLNTLDFADNALTDEERTVENYKELLTECIKVLPSAENDGDLISRQAVLDELEKWDWQDLYLPIHFKQILDDVPSVENKGEDRPKGHWIYLNGVWPYRWECNQCNSLSKLNFNFCPDCGADMRKAEKPETCKGCLEPCIMYEPDMRACKKKVTER